MTDPTTRNPRPVADPAPPPPSARTEPRNAPEVDVRDRAPNEPGSGGERTSDVIRRDIEETRADLGGTITDIEDRVSPRQIKERSKARARSRWQRIREQVMGTTDEVKGQVQSSADDVRDRVQSAGDEAADSMKEGAHEAREKVEGHPLAAGLIAFGGGMLASALLPASQKEQDAAERLREQVEEPVRQGVQEAGQQMKGDLTEQASERAKKVGQEAMGAAARTGTEAQESAQRVKGDAQQSAQQIRS